jgi:hypothetical protein
VNQQGIEAPERKVQDEKVYNGKEDGTMIKGYRNMGLPDAIR